MRRSVSLTLNCPIRYGQHCPESVYDRLVQKREYLWMLGKGDKIGNVSLTKTLCLPLILESLVKLERVSQMRVHLLRYELFWIRAMDRDRLYQTRYCSSFARSMVWRWMLDRLHHPPPFIFEKNKRIGATAMREARFFNILEDKSHFHTAQFVAQQFHKPDRDHSIRIG